MSATGADAFSRRKTQSKVYWSTIPKNKRDELEAAAAAAGTVVKVNEDGTAMVQAGATGTSIVHSSNVVLCVHTGTNPVHIRVFPLTLLLFLYLTVS